MGVVGYWVIMLIKDESKCEGGQFWGFQLAERHSAGQQGAGLG